MGVSDQNVRHGFAAHRIEQCLGVCFVVRTGIDDRDLVLAHDITDGAGKGERARIVAENPPHFGTDLVDHAGFQRKIAIERDVVVVDHGACVAIS